MRKFFLLVPLFFFFNNQAYSEIVSLSCFVQQTGQTYPMKIDLKNKTIFERFKFEKESTSEEIKFIEWQEVSKEVGKEYLQKFHNINLKDNTWHVQIIYAGNSDLISNKYNFSNYPNKDLIIHSNKIECKRK